jgi:small subunit ribosomal protein S20
MPIITSSVKDLRRTARRTERNRAAKGKLRSSLKQVRVSAATGPAQEAAEALRQATPIMDRAVSKGILHRNTAARHKSRLMRQINRLAKPATS